MSHYGQPLEFIVTRQKLKLAWKVYIVQKKWEE